MSSLQSIMNLDEDQQDASSPMNKKDKDSATPASGFRSQDPSSSTTSGHVIRPDLQHSPAFTAPSIRLPTAEASSTYYPGQQPTDQDQSSGSEVQQGKRPAEPSSAPSLSVASSGPADLRRQSSTSVDSMDQHGYGSAASSSSMGGGTGSGGYPPNHPRRPMGSPSPDMPIKLTPITGRVSRAKKGVPVHVCDQCNPPKTFTRAEHLRRHQLSHQVPRFPCNRCERVFHRQDLLTRHQQRHDQEGDGASQSEDISRRGSKDSSTSTIEQRMPDLSVGGLRTAARDPSSSQGFAATPSSFSAPGTPPTGSGPTSTMSPPPGSSGDQYGPSPGAPSSNNYSYEVHPSIGMESSPEPPTFGSIDYMAPRTPQLPLFVATQGLSSSAVLPMDNPPDLIHANDYSPWTSASESTYSAPSEISARRRGWRQHAHQTSLEWQTNADLMSTFSNGVRREISTSGALDTVTAPYYVSTAFPVSPHMAPVPHHNYNHFIGESLMTDFTDEHTQSLLDPAITAHHAVHQPPTSVRSQTHPTSISASGQMADTLVTPAPLPHRIDPMAQARQKEIVVDCGNADVSMGFGTENGSPHWNTDDPAGAGIPTVPSSTGLGGWSMGSMATMSLLRSVRNAIPSYIDIYWERFHIVCPIVHRRAFEGEEVLRCAMAAIATQYLNGKEDRVRGNQLHEYAWQEAKRHPQKNLQVMQAILLCEHFARFRGRKAVVRPSKPFIDLYSRVMDHNPNVYDSALASNTATFGNHQQTGMDMVKDDRWRTWLEEEGRRRLLAACFALDNHASTYHQQPRARDDIDHTMIPLTGPSESLWAANSADEWAAILESNPALGQPHLIPHLDSLRPEDVPRFAIFDQALILHAAALALPRRASRSAASKSEGQVPTSPDDLRTPTTASYAAQQLKRTRPDDRLTQLFSQSFSNALPVAIVDVLVAMHHTPLHDLLVVSGDSWVFTLKVLDPPAFVEHQKRLKAWTEGRSAPSPTSAHPTSPTATSLEGMSSAKATFHAARALAAYLDRRLDVPNWVTDISDYWAMYVCALIIWAFCHKAGKSSFSSSSGSPTTVKGAPMGEDETVGWLRTVAQLEYPEQVARMRQRREASAGVISMVKRRLEADCVGGRSRLYMDAVEVLKKLEELVNTRWF